MLVKSSSGFPFALTFLLLTKTILGRICTLKHYLTLKFFFFYRNSFFQFGLVQLFLSYIKGEPFIFVFSDSKQSSFNALNIVLIQKQTVLFHSRSKNEYFKVILLLVRNVWSCHRRRWGSDTLFPPDRIGHILCSTTQVLITSDDSKKLDHFKS